LSNGWRIVRVDSRLSPIHPISADIAISDDTRRPASLLSTMPESLIAISGDGRRHASPATVLKCQPAPGYPAPVDVAGRGRHHPARRLSGFFARARLAD